jgi:hypothetical protein
MKKFLKNKEIYERRYELTEVIPEFALIIESFEKGNGKCEECDEKAYALSLQNYLIYALQSSDKEKVKNILDHLDNDFIINGKRYSKVEIIEEDFIPKEKEMPSFWRTVSGFFRSVVGIFFKSLKNGSIMSSSKERKRRLAICRSCSSYDRSCSKCTECGCPMKRKVKFKYAECPRGKW